MQIFPENCVSIAASMNTKELTRLTLSGDKRNWQEKNHNVFLGYSFNFLLGICEVGNQRLVKENWVRRVLARKNKDN